MARVKRIHIGDQGSDGSPPLRTYCGRKPKGELPADPRMVPCKVCLRHAEKDEGRKLRIKFVDGHWRISFEFRITFTNATVVDLESGEETHYDAEQLRDLHESLRELRESHREGEA